MASCLIGFQQLSPLNLATQRCPWRDNWYTRGLPFPVLSYKGMTLSILTPTFYSIKDLTISLCRKMQLLIFT